MKAAQCNFCGDLESHHTTTEYLYNHQGQYLLVPDMPVEICDSCGMVYYAAHHLKQVEQEFFAIQRQEATPDAILSVPSKMLSERTQV